MLFRSGRYANVASTLALVVALGGTSYAAVAIPKSSVGSKQIIDSSVKSKDIKNGTLKGTDFKTGELPAGSQGPAGPAGPAGPQGPVGPSNGYRFDSGSDILDWTATDQTVATLSLPAGSYVLFAKTMGNNNAATVATMNCKLRFNGTVVDDGLGYLSLDGSGVDRGYVPLAGTATSAGPATASVTCQASANTGNWLSRTITAVKVGSIG
ncbi:hypothetical protein [Nocardioides sp. SYSU D00065]|uniref:hypothetical protein n=1 Tax=Nocardioides sp. SYSU D00065 TaxID=2817378 RepID=UPI001B3396C6|nr:hypothetical protein [Nocardioides sp. SYSU D00065]